MVQVTAVKCPILQVTEYLQLPACAPTFADLQPPRKGRIILVRDLILSVCVTSILANLKLTRNVLEENTVLLMFEFFFALVKCKLCAASCFFHFMPLVVLETE